MLWRQDRKHSRPILSKPTFENLDPAGPLLRIQVMDPASEGSQQLCLWLAAQELSDQRSSAVASRVGPGQHLRVEVQTGRGSRRDSGPRTGALACAGVWRQPPAALVGPLSGFHCTPAQHRGGNVPRRPAPGPLNPRYVFQPLLWWGSRTAAWPTAASLAWPKAPACEFNPRFLCGRCGLGKTPPDAGRSALLPRRDSIPTPGCFTSPRVVHQRLDPEAIARTACRNSATRYRAADLDLVR